MIGENRLPHLSPPIEMVHAVQHVRFAGWHLRTAAFLVDDSGFYCEALDDLQAGAAALVSTWAGRPVPGTETHLPAAIVDSARDWRRSQGRSY